MSFEEWKNKNLAKGESKTWIEWCGEAYEAGAASQQGEVDALNALGEMSEQKVDDLVLGNIELQKRIDDAVMYFECMPILYQTENYELGMKVLKGQNNDN